MIYLSVTSSQGKLCREADRRRSMTECDAELYVQAQSE